MANTPSENASRRLMDRRRSWSSVRSADVTVLTGMLPSFRRIDQLIMFSCHQSRCAAVTILIRATTVPSMSASGSLLSQG